MHGNPRNEIQQLRQDRDRAEERGQQERDRGVGGSRWGRRVSKRGSWGRKMATVKEFSISLKPTLCTLPGL